jgi:hypothetical protein
MLPVITLDKLPRLPHWNPYKTFGRALWYWMSRIVQRSPVTKNTHRCPGHFRREFNIEMTEMEEEEEEEKKNENAHGLEIHWNGSQGSP